MRLHVCVNVGGEWIWMRLIFKAGKFGSVGVCGWLTLTLSGVFSSRRETKRERGRLTSGGVGGSGGERSR